MLTFCSAKGSAGVTTLASLVGAIWPEARHAVVAECDPSGNDLSPRFGLSPETGMTTLVLQARNSSLFSHDLAPHLQQLPGGLAALVGPTSRDGARAVDLELGEIGRAVFPAEEDVLVDIGRWSPSSPGQGVMLRESDCVLLIAHADPGGVAHAYQARVELHRITKARSLLLLVGPKTFPVSEVQEAFGVDSVIYIPIDSAAARIVCGVPGNHRSLARSALTKAARHVAATALQGRSGKPAKRRTHRTLATPASREPSVATLSSQLSSNGHEGGSLR